LIGVAFLQVFETEVGSEKARGAILKCDALISSNCGTPHPLVAGPVGMIHDQKSHALHLCRSRESQNRLAVSEGADALEDPALGGNGILAAGNFERAFVALRSRRLPPLHFL